MVFAPARWYLVMMVVLTPLMATTFVLALMDGPSQFLSPRPFSLLIGTGLATMFRPEEVVEHERASQRLKEAGSGQVA
ncbi:hypothetical protein ASF98_01425 [Arthrobacter sp. Leaf337]|nr:hypothetical protein ASF98_01425 [Arthrobacter sp. Leaf337]